MKSLYSCARPLAYASPGPQNGQVCFFPDGSGRFVAGEDTDQSGGSMGGDPIPQGWGSSTPMAPSWESSTRPSSLPSPHLNTAPFGSAIASAAAVVDGLVMVGVGIGTRTGNLGSISDIVSLIPSDVVALCVPGTTGCAACNDGLDNDGDADFAGAEGMDPDLGCVSEADSSEVFGDLDYDGRVTVTDLDLLFAGFGLAAVDPGFQDSADLDRDMAITWLDYQKWLEAFRTFNAPPPPPAPAAPRRACGLLGIEILAAPGLAARVGRA